MSESGFRSTFPISVHSVLTHSTFTLQPALPFFPKKRKRKKKEIRSICLTPETLNVSANEDGHALSPAGKRRRR